MCVLSSCTKSLFSHRLPLAACLADVWLAGICSLGQRLLYLLPQMLFKTLVFALLGRHSDAHHSLWVLMFSVCTLL